MLLRCLCSIFSPFATFWNGFRKVLGTFPSFSLSICKIRIRVLTYFSNQIKFHFYLQALSFRWRHKIGKNIDFLNFNLKKQSPDQPHSYRMVTVPKAMGWNVHAFPYTEGLLFTGWEGRRVMLQFFNKNGCFIFVTHTICRNVVILGDLLILSLGTCFQQVPDKDRFYSIQSHVWIHICSHGYQRA